MIGRTAILVLLPLIILIGDYKGRRANETTGCVLNVRNIQQALRGYQGVNELGVGKVIPWSDLIGPGKMLGAHCRECPGGQACRLIPRMPDAGVLAAECPNPEHQRRIKETDTSGW